MRFFNRGSIQAKLLGIFALFFAASLAVGLMSAWRLAVLSRSTSGIESNVSRMLPLAHISRDGEQLAVLGNELEYAVGTEDFNDIWTQVQSVLTDEKAQWALYQPMMSAGREHDDGTRLQAAFGAMASDAIGMHQAFFASGDSSALATLGDSIGQSLLKFEPAMQDDFAYQAQQAAALNASAKAARFAGMLDILLGMAAMAGIGILAVLPLIRSVVRPITAMTTAMSRLAQHDIQIDVPGIGRADEIGAMAAAVQVFKENAQERARLEAAAQAFQASLDAKLKATEANFAAAGRDQKAVVDCMAAALAELAGGDLTTRFQREVTPAYTALRNDFNAALETLQTTMQSVAANTQGVRAGAAEITKSSDDLSRRTEQQAASLEETAAALDQITATVRKSAENAREAREVADAAKRDAEQSGTVVNETVAAMSSIEVSSRQIANIIGVIDEIAFQTNLLALNAGVEAARAGDAGRGFAVVATEVRALAQRSADAAKEIKSLISASGAQVDAGVRLVGETGKSLGRIVAQIGRLNALVQDIAASTAEQATGLAEVNGAVNQMDQVTQQNAAMVEESTAASHALADEAQELARLVGQFRIGEVAAAVTRRRPATVLRRPASSAARQPELMEEF